MQQTDGISEARAAIQHALTLDPTNATAHIAIAAILTQYDWDWSGAEAALTKALETEPGNARALTSAGFLCTTSAGTARQSICSEGQLPWTQCRHRHTADCPTRCSSLDS